MVKIIKRDGQLKDFDFKRIQIAITNAYEDVYGKERLEMLSKYNSEIEDVLDGVFERINEIKEENISVEEVQDIVIHSLKGVNKEVAKSYSDYREQRNIVRESKSQLVKEIMGLIDNTNIDVLTENSNKQSQLASTQRDLIAGEVSKHIARTTMIPKHLMDAHYQGKIKIHDLDYFLQGIYNCELVNIEDMLQNGTVINKKKIDKPKSLRTAMTLVTQIAAQISSSTYGGQTITLSHIAPFVRVSKEKIEKKYRDMNLPITQEKFKELVDKELRDEIKDSVQTFNYQISTLNSTNGQSPFISVAMYISENPEYEEEVVMLIEEFFKQRIEGMKNEYDVVSTQTFPKLLYFLDENNTYENSKYFWLTQLACKSVSLRMSPDFISVKKMKELTGHAFPCMGCRAFLSPFKDKDGNAIFYGRGNLGVCSISLAHVALSSGGDMDKFWKIFEERLDLCRQVCELRYNKMKGIKARTAPIIWQHGAIARLNADDDITKAIDERGFTVTIGYSSIYETVKYLTGKSHTTEEGGALAEEIMKFMYNKCEEYKKQYPHLRFALYGK